VRRSAKLIVKQTPSLSFAQSGGLLIWQLAGSLS